MIYISMLRGINVSGQKIIKMNELKILYESLGFKNVCTYIQSGNVIFDTGKIKRNELIEIIEEKIKDSFGFPVKVILRTKTELKRVIENNPLMKINNVDISRLGVTFISGIPGNSALVDLDKVKSKSEELFFAGKEIYLYCPDGFGRTKLSNNYFEKKLNVSATTRNWNTVNKLFELAQ